MNEITHIKKQFIEFWKETEKEKIFKIKGTSMLPLIRESDMIGVQPLANTNDLKIGDIALYTAQSGIIAHRIIGKFKKDSNVFFKEKGDSKIYPSIVEGQAVIGRVIKIYKEKRTIDLTNRFWRMINRIVGYYWKNLFACFDIMAKIKKTVFGSRNIPYVSSLYQKTIHFLVNLPSLIFRRQ